MARVILGKLPSQDKLFQTQKLSIWNRLWVRLLFAEEEHPTKSLCHED
jgi:hypothetical protein